MKVRLTMILWSLLGLVAQPVLGAEGRIPIYQVGNFITAPGRYIVTQSLVGTGATPIITVSGTGIDIDLNGFDLDNGPGPAAVILITNGNAVIHDGSLHGGGQGIDSPAALSLNYRNLLIANSVGDGIRGGTLAKIENVTIISPGAHGIHLLSGSGSNIITDVTVDHAAGNGIRFEGVVNSRIIGCNITFNGSHAIELTAGSVTIVVESNQMLFGSADGIVLSGASAVLVSKNFVTSSGNGINVLPGSYYAAIRDNVVDVGGVGIRIHSLGCSVERNHVSGCGSVGLHFIAGSTQNTYGRNSLLRNTNTVFGGCTGTYIPPDFCNDSSATDNVSFKDNLTTGGPLF